MFKQKTEISLNEKEKEFVEKVRTLEPILNEAQEYNEVLKYQVKCLEEALKGKDKNILILQDRNYQSEVRLSKTRRYIQHREREFNEEFHSLNIDFMNRVRQMNSAKKQFEDINNRIFNERNSLIGKINMLQKNLSLAENKVKSLQHNHNNNLEFLNFNAKKLAETLKTERENWKSLSLKIEKMQSENSVLQHSFSEARSTIGKYKVLIQDLQAKKNVPDNSSPCGKCITLRNHIQALMAEVDQKNKKIENATSDIEIQNRKLEEIAKDYTKNEDSFKNLKNKYENSMKKNDKENKKLRNQISDLEDHEKDFRRVIAQLSNENAEIKLNGNKKLLKEYRCAWRKEIS